MHQPVNVFPIADQLSYFGSAEILEHENHQGQVRIRWQQNLKTMSAVATIAVARNKPLLPKTNVLVAGNDVNSMYVIGLLHTQPDIDSNTIVRSANGAFAQLNKTGEQESLSIFSDENELLFKYEPATRTSIVNMPNGDLELNACKGNIILNAAKTVEINGDTLNLNSKKLSIKSFVADMVLGRLETTTETLVENAKNVYRTVKELTQLRTGRNRTFVEETYQLNADKVLLKSENDVKVKAEKIHLG